MLLRVCARVRVCAIGPTRLPVYERLLEEFGRHSVSAKNRGAISVLFLAWASLRDYCLLLVCLCRPVPQALYLCSSHGATAAALQGIPFVTATDGARLRVFVPS